MRLTRGTGIQKFGHAVKYYHRYKLSLRDVSELMLDGSVEVIYEILRQ